jgi:thiamine-monophosphate kinase
VRERDFIDWICSQPALDPRIVPVGPGDDCAVVTFGADRLLVTTDQVLDGVHFVLSEHGPKAAGRKALARNLSDIAAMAGVPVAAVATLAMPRGLGRQEAEAVYAGLRELAEEFHSPLVGGDVGVWDGPLAIGVTVFGRCGGPAGQIEPVRRSGAKVGDAVCVTGRLGGAWRSLRHLEFTPRITEAVQLASGYRLRSMIDISDGLATDLWHICRASGVGAEIVAEQVPVHPDAGGLDAALGDGEDYELLFTVPPEDARRLCQAQPLRVNVAEIGRIVEGAGLTLVGRDGRREPLPPLGWEHKTANDAR